MIRLKELRSERKISQQKFASDIGVAQNTVSNWEAGNRDPGTDMIVKIADYFGCTTDYLLGRSPLPQSEERETPSEEGEEKIVYGVRKGSPDLTDEEIAILKRFVRTLHRDDE